MSSEKILVLRFELFDREVIDMDDKIVPIVEMIFGDSTCTCCATVALFIFVLAWRYFVYVMKLLTARAKSLLSSNELIKLLFPTPESPTSPTILEDGSSNSLNFVACWYSFRMLDPFLRYKFELESTATSRFGKARALARASWTSIIWAKAFGGSSDSTWWGSLRITEPERWRYDGDGERLSCNPVVRESALGDSILKAATSAARLSSLRKVDRYVPLGIADGVIWIEGVREARCGRDCGVWGDVSLKLCIPIISCAIALPSSAGSVGSESRDAVGEATVEVLRFSDEDKSRSTDGKGLSGSWSSWSSSYPGGDGVRKRSPPEALFVTDGVRMPGLDTELVDSVADVCGAFISSDAEKLSSLSKYCAKKALEKALML
jgi:hypothetical protein